MPLATRRVLTARRVETTFSLVKPATNPDGSPDAPRVVLVGCCGPKLQCSDDPDNALWTVPAHSLYLSELFVLSLAYAQTAADEVFIVSAFYGAIRPEAMVRHYDRTMAEVGGKRARAAWGERAVNVVARELGGVVPQLVILAGKDYADPIAWAARGTHGWPAPEQPLARIAGIGPRKAWLRAHAAEVGP